MIFSLHKSKELVMASATLSSKGQVTLPKSVRERLGIEAGDRLEFIESEQGFLVVAATRDIRSLKGIVGRPRKPVAIEEMHGAIEKMGRMP
jgi:antitoxin PrlF